VYVPGLFFGLGPGSWLVTKQPFFASPNSLPIHQPILPDFRLPIGAISGDFPLRNSLR
jgi:hypothetical protein